MKNIKVPNPCNSTALPPYPVWLVPTVCEKVGAYFHTSVSGKSKGETIFYFHPAIGASPPNWTEIANTPLPPLPRETPHTPCLLGWCWACKENTDMKRVRAPLTCPDVLIHQMTPPRKTLLPSSSARPSNTPSSVHWQGTETHRGWQT